MTLNKKWDAYQTCLIIRAVAAFGFGVTFGVNLVYQVAMVGLNPLQLVLVGTTLELAAFIFEIPTGVLADVYSRRLSVIIGYAIIGVGFIIEAIPMFATVLLAQVIWGLGYAFISGASDAWIVDEIGEDRAKQAFVRAERLSIIMGFVALWTSIGLGTLALNLPHLIGGGTLIALSVLLIFVMPEEGFKQVPKEERTRWQDLFKTLRQGLSLIRVRRILGLIIASTLFLGLFSEGWDRLKFAHLLENFGLPDPMTSYSTLILFGVIGSVGSLLAFVGNSWLESRKLTTHRELSTGLLVSYSLMVVSVLVFSWAGNLVLALIGFWGMGAMASISYPIYQGLINTHIDSEVRATVLSLSSQANAIGQIVGGPPVGYVGIQTNLRIAMSISAVILLPAVLLVKRIQSTNIEASVT